MWLGGKVERQTGTGKGVASDIPGKARFFGLLGREDDYVIPWTSIEKIGEDIILVRHSSGYARLPPPRRSGSL